MGQIKGLERGVGHTGKESARRPGGPRRSGQLHQSACEHVRVGQEPAHVRVGLKTSTGQAARGRWCGVGTCLERVGI